MDYFPISIFQYEQADELLQISSIIPGHQADQLPVITTSQDGCDLTHKLDHRRQRKSSISCDETDENPNENNKKKKKIIHRDIERQRRHEMVVLHANLQSLLPIEYIKLFQGKRSMSDHMHEAVKYIKHLQNKIQELNKKRDELKRLFNYPTKATENSGCDSLELRHSCTSGVEVVINARQGLALSRVLQVLMGEGLIIVGFISTKVNQRLLHTIEAELSDGQRIDLCNLQKKLKNFIISSSN